MRVKCIAVRNYRGLESFDMSLEKDITVIIGENGSGKSSVVSAIRLLLWAYVRAYGRDVRRGSVPTIKAADVLCRNGKRQYPCSVKGEHWFSDEGLFQSEWDGLEEDDEDIFNWSDLYQIACSVAQEGRRCKWGNVSTVAYQAASKSLDVICEDFGRLTGENPKPTDLPVIACYGTNRLWKKTASRRNFQREIPRLAGYDGAINLSTSFMGFNIFVENLFESVGAGLFDKKHAVVLWKGVVSKIEEVTGWRLLLPVKGESKLTFECDGSGVLELSQLGDGVRGVIEVVGDLACRCALLNPHYGTESSDKTNGVVLIDEIDLHLHPAWQQTIVNQLRVAFPLIQFIVTTHSPQVVSTVKRDNVRVLGRNGDNRVVAGKPLAHTYGEPSGDVLQAVMQVDPQPPVPEKVELDELTSLVEQGCYDEVEAVQLMDSLSLALGEKHPQLLRLKRSILRQRVLR